MKCFECGQPIQNKSQKVMEKVRMFRWSDTLVPFHRECWEKMRISEAKRNYAKAFAESLILLAVTFIAAYLVV